MPKILVTEWLETERGWGQRPDGYSLHLTLRDMKKYIQEYWDSMPDRGPGGEAPDEYSRPCGPENGVWCECSDELYQQVIAAAIAHNGLRVWENDGVIEKSQTGLRTFVDRKTHERRKAQEKKDLTEAIPSPS
jgi:hypothetical protein